jgi:hypothetical protein
MHPTDPHQKRDGQPTEGWLARHLPILLYGWFFLGMALCGLLAPPDRVAELGSSVITEGWHLSLLAALLGLAVVWLYTRRLRPISKVSVAPQARP